jgi:hypothetical protein
MQKHSMKHFSMDMELVIYKKFFEQDQVNGLVDILKENEIAYSVSEDRESLDSLYGDKQFKQQYFVKIKKADFETVDNILINQAREHLDNVDKDHYLFTFSNEELYDILSKPDEWSEFDFLLAQKILRDKGERIGDEQIKNLKNERIRELAKPG